MGALAWGCGALVALFGVKALPFDRVVACLMFLIAGLLLPPVTTVLRHAVGLKLSVKAKALAIFGLLIVSGVELSGRVERERNRVTQHGLRQRAESTLRQLSVTRIPSLPDSTLTLLAHWTDSTTDSSRRAAVITAWQARNALRTLEHRARDQAFRESALAVLARARRGADTSQCRSPDLVRLTTLLREHPGWRETDLVRVACQRIWIGMTAEQLAASWGRPEHINREVDASGVVHEEWIYGAVGPFLHVDDAVLTGVK